MAQWIDITAAKDLAPGQRHCAQAGDIPVIVLNVDGQLKAIRNTCPHAGLPLAEAELRGKVLTCPFHGYAYHIDNGRNLDYPDTEPPVRTYPVRIENDQIQIDLDARAPGSPPGSPPGNPPGSSPGS